MSAATTSDRRGTAPPPPSTRRASTRFLAGTVALLAAVAGTTVLAPSASATLTSAGPIDEASRFPASYSDSTGLALELCQDGPSLCLAGPEPIQDVHAGGGDAEAFWFHTSAEVGPFLVEDALEAAYAGDGPDQEVTFMRSQAGGVGRAGAQYRFTDPWGAFPQVCTADSSGRVQPAKGCRFETNPIPGNFTAALGGRLGPFLTWDTYGSAAGAPPAGYIGDGVTPHKVTGSPTGYNKFRVEGPGVNTTNVDQCPDVDGPIADCDETDLATVQGKVAAGVAASVAPNPLVFGDVDGTAPVTKTITYRNTGTGVDPITVSSVTLGGADADRFATVENCTTATTGIAPGANCTIDVTFTPDPGLKSAATLTISDNTPVGTRTVNLSGSNLGAFNVAPTSLAFPSTPVGSVSAEDTVVVGNDGNGPLTVTPTLTGFSAAQYRLGTNGCTEPLPPNGGCEIGVKFAPTSTGVKAATLRLTDATGQTVDVALSGTGATAPPAAPGAPTIGTATAGNGQATVTWTAPTNRGNPILTSYKVQAFAGTSTTPFSTTTVTDAAATSGTVVGLANGTSYTFKVIANNGTDSPASAASNAVTPSTVPGAPTIGTPAAGDSSATVRWTAPASNGGAAITGYSVRVFSGGTEVGAARTAPATATSLNVTGLTNGTAYTFDVAATNTNGTGAPSAQSAAVTPDIVVALPGAPTIGTATGGDTQATVNWTAPANNGGGAISGYSVQVRTGTTVVRTVPVGNVTTTTVTGLTNGTAYNFRVAATNSAGTGSFSAASNTVTPAAAPTVPAAPAAPTATAGNTSATVNWTAPANGGSAITGYTLQVFSGTTQVGADRVLGNVTSTSVTGLTNGTAYTFRVAARNSVGTGTFSAASNAVTPTVVVTAPGAPTIGTATAGDAQATVNWTAPANNGGAAITAYTVEVRTGTTVVRNVPVGNVTSTVVTGLTNGTAYNFRVAATNSAGTGSFSAASNAVTPTGTTTTPATTLPGTPTGATATAGNAQATVSWVAPTNTGGGTITGYRITVRTGTTVVRTELVGAVTSSVVTNLINGTPYNFRIAAINSRGTGSVSTPSNEVTPTAGGTTGDSVAPSVTGRGPAVDARNVAVGANITATFSEAVQGVGTSSFVIRPAATPTSTPIAGTVTQGTANQWILNPTANLPADTKYTVTLTGGAAAIRDTAGNPLVTTSWSFTTGPAPTVTARTPAANATAVSRTANITATFSEAVQGVSGTTVRLVNAASGAAITATVTYNATTRVATLDPSATLAANTQYRVRLIGSATEIRDLADNPLSDVTWTFTTGA